MSRIAAMDVTVWDVTVWDVTVFTKNRERLLQGDIAPLVRDQDDLAPAAAIFQAPFGALRLVQLPRRRQPLQQGRAIDRP